MGKRLTDGEIVAIKKVLKSNVLQTGEAGCILMERIILGRQSKWLLPFHEAFQDQSHLYLITEFMSGGSLEDLSCRPDFSQGEEDSKKLPEEMVRFYMAQTVLALEELHAMGSVHRDLKPGNLLINKDGNLRLADFGCAIKLEADGKVSNGRVALTFVVSLQ